MKTNNNLTFNSYLQNNEKTQKQSENIKTQKDLNLSSYSQENTKTQKDQLKNDEREVLPHMKSDIDFVRILAHEMNDTDSSGSVLSRIIYLIIVKILEIPLELSKKNLNA